MSLFIFVSVAAISSAASVLGFPSLRGRIARALAGARARLAERARLRIAAALLDLDNHLMLCDEERRARCLRTRLERAERRGQRLEDVLRRRSGARTDEVTFEAVVGSRAQEGNPARTLSLSCTVARPPEGAIGADNREPVVAWRVTNRPSEGRRGPISYSEVPDLERALISYHAPAVSPLAGGGRFYDEGVHDAAEPAA